MIETACLRLRPCREEDKPAFAAMLNTPAMTAHIGGVKSRAETDALIDKRIADQARDGFSYWAVETLDDDALVGTCGLRRGLNYAGTPVEGLHEIGWRIVERLWGRGIAREAAEAALAWGWAHTDAPLIAAWTTQANVASSGLMQRLGMSRRPELDFQRTDMAADDSHGAMLVYAIERPR